MAWLRIDDGFAEHAKIGALTDRSFRLHVTGLCYCARNLTDGVLDDRALRIVCAIVARGSLRRNIAELVDAGLWHRFAGGYEINDFLDYNPTSVEVKELQEKRRDAGRRGGKASGKARAKANTEASASPDRSTPSRPVPLKTDAFTPTPTEAREKHRVREQIERSLKAVG